MTSVVLEHYESVTINDTMMRLVYAKTRLDTSKVWNMLTEMAVVYQELEKYGLAFLEISPRSWIMLPNGEIRLSMFHGVMHPYTELSKDEYINENLPAPEYIKHGKIHPKSNIYGLGYLIYLVTGLKFAFQFYDPSKVKRAVLNFYKVLPNSKMVRVYPEDLTSLVLAMLHKNPDGRPTWGSLFITARRDPGIRAGGIKS